MTTTFDDGSTNTVTVQADPKGRLVRETGLGRERVVDESTMTTLLEMPARSAHVKVTEIASGRAERP